MFYLWFRTFFSGLGVAFISFLVTILTSKFLGVEGRGLFASFVFFSTFFANLSQLGLGVSFVFFKRDRKELAWGNVTIVIFAVLLIYSLLFIGSSSFLFLENYEFLNYLIPSVLMLTCVYSFITLAQVEENLIKYNFLRFMPNGIFLLIFVILYFFGFEEWYIACYSISIFISLLLGFWLLRKYFVKSIGWRFFEISSLRDLFTYGLKVYATSLTGLLINNFDKVYLFFWGSVREFGIYSTAYVASRVFGSVQDSISTMIFSKYAGKNNDSDSMNAILFSFRITFYPMLLVALIFGFFGDIFLRIFFGNEFAAGNKVFFILLLECVISSSGWLMAQKFNIDGKPGIVLLRQVFSLMPIPFILIFLRDFDPMILISLVLLGSSVFRFFMTFVFFKNRYKIDLYSFAPKLKDFIIVFEIFSKLRKT